VCRRRAAGDSAAARDPFTDAGHDYPPTAQNAQRQGVVIGRNIAADLGRGTPRPYRHRNLGLVADRGEGPPPWPARRACR
jgi:NADH:ubiquinone reductase (H+-translocating)